MRFVPVEDVDPAMDVVCGVCGFGLVLGLLFDDLDEAVDASGESLVLCLLLEHLVPDDVLGFEALDFLEGGFVDLVYIGSGDDG